MEVAYIVASGQPSRAVELMTQPMMQWRGAMDKRFYNVFTGENNIDSACKIVHGVDTPGNRLQ